jgi:O-antigen/teichoic acid export membrane protein
MPSTRNISARRRAVAQRTGWNLAAPLAGDPAAAARMKARAQELAQELAAALRQPGSQTRRFAGAVAGSAGLRLFGMALGFLVGVQLARYLGVEQYGVYGYAMAVATLASTVALFGLQLLAVRETSIAVERKDWPGLSGFLRWSWARAIGFAFLLAIAAGLWLARSGTASAMPLPLWAAGFVLASAAVALTGPMLRGLGQIVGGQSLDTVVVPALQCAMLAGAMLFGALDAATALALGVAATAMAALAGLVWLRLRVPGEARWARPRIDGARWRRAMLPMGATTIMRALDAQLPMLVLGLLVAAADLGTFRVALASMLLISFPYTLISIVSPPLAAQYVAAGEQRRLQRLASATTLGTLLPTVAVVSLLWLFGVPLIRFVFGAEYEGAFPVLMVLGVAGVLTSLFGVPAAILFATGHERQVTIAFAAGVVLLGLLLPLLAVQGGIQGAAWAVVAGVLAREILLWRYCRSHAGIDPAPWAVSKVLDRP